MKSKEFKNMMFNLIAKGKLSEAVDTLLKLNRDQIQPTIVKDIISLSFQYQEITKKERMGLPVELSQKIELSKL